MQGISLQTVRKVIPMIYSYTTPQIHEHDGWTKIGYTERQSVEERINQQTHTVNVKTKIEWKGNAIFEDGSGERFTDRDFHAFLIKKGIDRNPKTEWFHVDGPAGKTLFHEFKDNRGIVQTLETVPYTLRKEQEEAVEKAKNYAEHNENGEFLWNAKPRFGKTLAAYDLCKRLQAKKVLIVTNRPAIANSWYSDFVKFLGDQSGYKFVSDTDSLKGKSHVLTREQFIGVVNFNLIEFLSLQDLKGSIYFGGTYSKLKPIQELEWDMLIIDEAHEGVDTLKTDAAFEKINRKFTLHLSGTPFKALANSKFEDSAIYNWTYADEQEAKKDWDISSEHNNPYENLPCLNLYTYQMSEIIRDEASKGIDINGKTEEYAFDLKEFFAVKNGKFLHDESVTKFLDSLTTQTKFPFSTDKLRNELKHTFWILDRVESAKALASKLKDHPVFSSYAIVVAAGDGKLDPAEETQKSYDKVIKAIEENDKTITLSVGQLTTGVTIPEWSAVLMLSNMRSPALYMQAAFRAQNPCMYQTGTDFYRKENAYVFDFDPARTLLIYEEFANDLSVGTVGGKGTSEDRKQNIKKLLNFFPVLGEDDSGEMILLDAEKVLTIPRKVRSKEVVRSGFMSNFLFQNISGVFGAPKEVMDIINSFTPVDKARTKKQEVSVETTNSITVSKDTGEVVVPEEIVIGTATQIFGEKIFGEDDQEQVLDAIAPLSDNDEIDLVNATEKTLNTIKETFKNNQINQITDIVKEHYGSQLPQKASKKINNKINGELDSVVEKIKQDHLIDQRVLEQEKENELQNRFNTGKTEKEIEEKFKERRQDLLGDLAKTIQNTLTDFANSAEKAVVESAEKIIAESNRSMVEDSVRNHLRGFSRTIPSFLMAYGDPDKPITLSNFDKIIPDEVFKEVTSISLEQFRFLRDGGTYRDSETGEEKHFQGNLFDQVVFNDSVKEFLDLKVRLADYFDESNHEDIFDYIPPQRTSQIFTPKAVVKMMVDNLEKENPGCFDNPDYTFIDMYMKSGLYVAEIVKRLYKSERLKEVYKDPEQRLKHIFEKQVFGLAPTDIIYRIAVSFILGFDKTKQIKKHNLRKFDVTPFLPDGSLEKKLNETFKVEK